MPVPILGQKHYSYIVVEMLPGPTPGTFNVQVDTQHFPEGLPLAVQSLLQAVVYLQPQAFQAIAEAAVEGLLRQQRDHNNGNY